MPVLLSASPLATCDPVAQLLLCVCTDDWQPGRGECDALHGNVVELLLAVWVGRRGLDFLGIVMQRVVELAKQPAHGRRGSTWPTPDCYDDGVVLPRLHSRYPDGKTAGVYHDNHPDAAVDAGLRVPLLSRLNRVHWPTFIPIV